MRPFIYLLLMIFLLQKGFAHENKIDFRSQLTCVSPENELWKSWDSPEGILRLQRSTAKENFWKLLRFYDSQTRLTYCGVATAVVVLNSLAIEAPKSNFLGKFRMFTQEEFFSDNVCAVIDPKDVAERGVILEELATILKTFPLEVSKFPAQELSSKVIRELLIEALQNPNQRILALYQRTELRQEGSGHWSPVAAYDAESDSFLVLDVAKFKYPPAWINADTFINSMQTANIHGQSRGFLIIGT